MHNFYTELFVYNQKCNELIIDVCQKQQDIISDRTKKLFNHILNAHHIWIKRIHQQVPEYGPWHDMDIAQWEQYNIENHTLTSGILEKPNLQEEFTYQNTKGIQYTNTVQDTLFHIINHSTYHRGQIAADFRTTHLNPVVTDYIFFRR